MNPQQITVTGGTLYSIAGRYLGDPLAWTLIATLNGLNDPVISGTVTLTLPQNITNTNDGILYQ